MGEEEARAQSRVSGARTRANDTGCPPGMSNQSSFAVHPRCAVVSWCFCAKGMEVVDSGGQSGTHLGEKRMSGGGADSGGFQGRCPPSNDHPFSPAPQDLEGTE